MGAEWPAWAPRGRYGRRAAGMARRVADVAASRWRGAPTPSARNAKRAEGQW